VNKSRHVAFLVVVTLLLLALGSAASFQASSTSDAFKKFSFSYFPSFDTGRIGVFNQMEIELNLTSSGDAFYNGVPVTVSAAGGIFSNSSNSYVQNVTILFTGSTPDESQPANGIILGQVIVAGIVLFPTSYCATRQNGVIFSEPILCGFNNTIIWQNAGTYHPIVTVYYNNGTEPFVDNDASPSDTISVTQAPPIVTFSSTIMTTTTNYNVVPANQNPYMSFGAIVIYAIGAVASIITIYESRIFSRIKNRKKNNSQSKPQMNPQKKSEVKRTKGDNEKK